MTMNRRQFIYHASLASASALTGCATYDVASKSFDAVVANTPNAHRSAPTFSSIQAALDAAPSNSIAPYRILVTKGRWREKCVVDKPHIQLTGEDRHESVISFDAYAAQLAPDGKQYGTSRTATVTVRAPEFAARNLTIENAFDHLAFVERQRIDGATTSGAQAVALMLGDGSDRTTINECDITGYQDTLYVDAGRSRFNRCAVSGTVDFIFGGGEALFERCEILSRARSNAPRQGVIAAPSTLRDREFGLTFAHCRLTKEKAVPANSVALGRAWRPTRTFADGRYGDPSAVGKTVYLNCWMDDHIAAEGWDAMVYGGRDGTRVALQPEDARFFEYESRGPGARRDARRRVLSALEAKRYAVGALLSDWQLD